MCVGYHLPIISGSSKSRETPRRRTDSQMTLPGKPLTEIVKPDLHCLFRLHAAACSRLVEARADTIFSPEWELRPPTPKDSARVPVIMACLLNMYLFSSGRAELLQELSWRNNGGVT